MLSDLAITVIKANSDLKAKLCAALNLSEQSLYRHMRQNRPFGILTTAGIVEIITAETGLTQNQILELEKVTA